MAESRDQEVNHEPHIAMGELVDICQGSRVQIERGFKNYLERPDQHRVLLRERSLGGGGSQFTLPVSAVKEIFTLGILAISAERTSSGFGAKKLQDFMQKYKLTSADLKLSEKN